MTEVTVVVPTTSVIMSTLFTNVETKETKDSSLEESSFYFKCNACLSTALGTNGHMLLTDPMDMFADPKKYETNFLYCGYCEILENMDGRDCVSEVVILQPAQPEDVHKTNMGRKIREYIFS